MDDDDRRRAGEPAEVALDQVARGTDSDPFACQPAPESAVSTCGAKTASASATTAQAIATARTWSAAQPPRRPTGPTASGCSTWRRSGGCFGYSHSLISSLSFHPIVHMLLYN